MTTKTPKPKMWIQELPHNCSHCEAQGLVEPAEGYCPECNAMFSSKCWVIHHRALGVKTHKAWAIQAPQKSSSSGSQDASTTTYSTSPRSNMDQVIDSNAPAATSPRKSQIMDSFLPSNFPGSGTAQASSHSSIPITKPMLSDSPSDTVGLPSSSTHQMDLSSITGTSSSHSLSKADKKAEKAARSEKRRSEKEARRAEKERARQERRDKKRSNSISSSSDASTSSDAPSINHRASIAGIPTHSTNTSLSPDTIQGSTTSPNEPPSPRRAKSMDRKSVSLSPRADAPVVPPKPFRRTTSNTSATEADKKENDHSPRDANQARPQAPPKFVSGPSNDGSSKLTRGQSALLGKIGQKVMPSNATTLMQPQTVVQQPMAVVHQPSALSPVYCLVALESDVKPLTDQSTAGDFPIMQQEELVRFLNDFAPDMAVLDKLDRNKPPEIQFSKLSRMATPVVGIHGNKEEIVAFLQPRVGPKVKRSLWDYFDKPGIYAVVANSLPPPHAANTSVTSSSTKSRLRDVFSSKPKQTTPTAPLPSTGQNTVFMVLWHTTDAYMQMFSTANRTLHLFALLNAMSSYRIALYSETEALHLLRLDNGLMTNREDIWNMKKLPDAIKDVSVKPIGVGSLVFGKTNMIQISKYLMRAILSIGTFGDKKELCEANGSHIPEVSFLGGSHSISFRVSPRNLDEKSSGQDSGKVGDTHVMAVAIQSVPNLLAQWGSDGTIDLSNIPDDEFALLLTDGKALDWTTKSQLISEEEKRVESAISVPKFSSLEALVDAVIRAHLRTNVNVVVLDSLFEHSVESVPSDDRKPSFVSYLSDDQTLFEHSPESDEQLLQTYGDKAQLSTISPETPYLAALSRLALAKSALKLVRVLKNKSPDDQASFIINTMDSPEENINQLFESLQGYPEFEKTHHNYFQSTDLASETDARIRWYFISLYDNIILHTRQHVIQNLPESFNTLDKLQVARGAGERATFEAWKSKLISDYRVDLNARLKSIFDFKLLGLSATGQSTSHLVRNVVLSYKRDSAGKSATITLKPSPEAQTNGQGGGTDSSEEKKEHSVLTFTSSDWLLADGLPNSPLATTNPSLNHNHPSIRIVPASCKNFFAPTKAKMATNPPPALGLSNSAAAPADNDISVYVFNSASLNVVVTVVTRMSKNETLIYAAGGALVGTLPVYCTHVAFSEETMLLALCGAYVQLYRLLDGGKALSTVPLVSFNCDGTVYGALEQVSVVGETCYFYTTVIQHMPSPTGHNKPDAPALPPRPDRPDAPTPTTTKKVCMIFKASPSGGTVRLSPPDGITPIDNMVVLPTQSHVILVRNIPAKGLIGELWQTDGFTVSIFPDISLSGHPPETVSNLQVCSLNGVLHLVSASKPGVINGALDAKLYITHLQITGDATPMEDALNKASRKTSPCENYLSYFAEGLLRYSACSAIHLHHSNPNAALNTATKPLRVLLNTNDASIFTEFSDYIDRYRTVLRYAMLSSNKLHVRRAAKLDVYFHLPKPGTNEPRPSSSQKGILEPIVPFLHHTLLRTKQTNRFATQEYDDLAVEAGLLTLTTIARSLICLVPVPLVSSTPRGILVAPTEGGSTMLPHAEIMALKAQLANNSKTSGPPISLPNQIMPRISFGMIEAWINAWEMPTKIITSFGSCGTGKSSLLNHVFGTMFETSTPHLSPFFVNNLTLQVDTPFHRAGTSNQVGGWISIVPSPTVLYIVIDFESILSQKPAAEQALLSVLNFSMANLTLWRSATPFMDEHFEILRSISMEKDRLVNWTQMPTNQPLLPWPKSYNSLLVVSDTTRINDLEAAKKMHHELARASIKHYESNPGPHMKPVLHTMVKNRFSSVALPITQNALAGNYLALNAKGWKLGPMSTNYLQQDVGFYQALGDHIAPFLDPIIAFDTGSDALTHIKRHLSYILWSQTAPIELPPRLEEVVNELDYLVTNALIFGQCIRFGQTSQSTTPTNGSQLQRKESKASNDGITIGPLGDLSAPSKVVGCPVLEFSLLGIPDPLTTDFERLQQYFPEEGLVLPIGTMPLPFNPIDKPEWGYYSYIDVISLWNKYVCNREQAILESDWTTSLQLFLNMLITRRALRVDFWIKLHAADIPSTSHLHHKVAVLREKAAVHFDKIKSSWKLCGQPCGSCYYTCTLQSGHMGNHDCLVPVNHACTSKCPNCSTPCPVPAGHRRDKLFHRCPVSCQKK